MYRKCVPVNLSKAAVRSYERTITVDKVAILIVFAHRELPREHARQHRVYFT